MSEPHRRVRANNDTFQESIARVIRLWYDRLPKDETRAAFFLADRLIEKKVVADPAPLRDALDARGLPAGATLDGLLRHERAQASVAAGAEAFVRVRDLEEQNERYRVLLDEIVALHVPCRHGTVMPMCEGCGDDWPCSTRRLLAQHDVTVPSDPRQVDADCEVGTVPGEGAADVR